MFSNLLINGLSNLLVRFFDPRVFKKWPEKVCACHEENCSDDEPRHKRENNPRNNGGDGRDPENGASFAGHVWSHFATEGLRMSDIGKLRDHDRAGRAKELPVTVAFLVDTLKLVIALWDAFAALPAEVDETFRAAVGIRIEMPPAGRAFCFWSEALVCGRHRCWVRRRTP